MHTLRWIRTSLRPPAGGASFDLEGWLRWLFNLLCILLVLLGFPVAMALSVPRFWAAGQFHLVALDIAFFLLGLWHVARRGRTFLQHPASWLGLAYLLTVAFHIVLGPGDARPGWLMLCVTLAAVSFGARGALAAALGNLVLVTGLYFALGPHHPAWQGVWQGARTTWFSYVVNITLLSLAAGLTAGFLITRLNQALLRERGSSEDLKRDISARKRAEGDLQASQRLLAQIVDFLPDATFAIDTQGKVILWNRAIEKLTGVAAADMLGRGDYAYAVPFYGERRPVMIDLVRRWDDATAATYRLVQAQDGLLVSETVNPPFMKREAVFWNAACRLQDADGRDLGAIEAIRDITGMRRAEKAVRESEVRFRAFFNSNPEGVVLMDLEGRIQNVNKAFLRMTGYLFDDLEGRPVEAILPPELHAEARSALRTVPSGIIEDLPREFDICRKDGGRLPVSVRGWLITDEESRPVAVGAFVKDVSRELALQREKSDLEGQLIQSQKMEAVGTLAGGIAHDFNNLLGAMVGYTELALMELPEDGRGVQSHLEQVLGAGRKAADLVRQILRFSRREAPTLTPLALTPLLTEGLKLMRLSVPPRIAIEADFSADPDTILADATQIHQVVMNLCTNACQAMAEGEGVLNVSLKNRRLEQDREFLSMRVPAGDCLEIAVADTGPGIPPEHRHRIFEPYFTTKAVGDGTGLGLAVSMGIVKNHGGLMEVESVPGAGSTFRLLFPAGREGAAPAARRAPELPRGRGQHILVVDDEPYFGDVVRQHLVRLGYRASVFQRSPAAWEAFQAAPEAFDLVITDQTMPEMSGLELVGRVRGLRPAIPMVICTGFSEALTRESARRYAIAAFLMKPVTCADLARTLHRVLEGGDDDAWPDGVELWGE